MKLFITTLTGKTVIIEVEENDSIMKIKYKIQDIENVSPDLQRLIFAGVVLEDNLKLSDYNIREDTDISLVYRMRGGMFHETSGKNGSFANTSNIVMSLDGDDSKLNSVNKEAASKEIINLENKHNTCIKLIRLIFCIK
jgi:hypothetical protein